MNLRCFGRFWKVAIVVCWLSTVTTDFLQIPCSLFPSLSGDKSSAVSHIHQSLPSNQYTINSWIESNNKVSSKSITIVSRVWTINFWTPFRMLTYCHQPYTRLVVWLYPPVVYHYGSQLTSWHILKNTSPSLLTDTNKPPHGCTNVQIQLPDIVFGLCFLARTLEPSTSICMPSNKPPRIRAAKPWAQLVVFPPNQNAAGHHQLSALTNEQ